jgi:hypothetical protein
MLSFAASLAAARNAPVPIRPRYVPAVTADSRPDTAGQQARMTMLPSSFSASELAMDTADYWLYSVGLALVVALVAFAG